METTPTSMAVHLRAHLRHGRGGRVQGGRSPDSVHDLLGLLQAELAPLGVWLDLAKAYLQRGKEEQFREIMATGCSPGASRSRSDSSASTRGCLRGVKPHDRARLSRAPTRMRECLFRSCLPRARSDLDPPPRPSPIPLQKSRRHFPTPYERTCILPAAYYVNLGRVETDKIGRDEDFISDQLFSGGADHAQRARAAPRRRSRPPRDGPRQPRRRGEAHRRRAHLKDGGRDNVGPML